MINTTETIEDYKICQGLDPLDPDSDDCIEEEVVRMYMYFRLKGLNGVAGITWQRIEKIIDMLADIYFESEYSIDLMCNAIYNYINAHSKCPSDKLIYDDIEKLLEEYGEVNNE